MILLSLKTKQRKVMDISIRGLTEQLNAEIAYLKVYLQVEKDSGFTNGAQAIELLAVQLFKASGLADFTNANLVKVNFPAIDLHEPKPNGKGIAAQVTSTASVGKINKTIKQFEKDRNGTKLVDQYEKLYVLGLLKAAKNPKGLPSYCEVLSADDIIQKIIHRCDQAAMYDAIHAIRTGIQRPTLLQPSRDIPSLMVVLGFIHRSAVAHRMFREGSIAGMLRGLDEVLEVANRGEIKGKSIAKMQHEYANTEIIGFISEVTDSIIKIKSVINGASNSSNMLTQAEEVEIDKLKQSIIDGANSISTQLGIKFSMALN